MRVALPWICLLLLAAPRVAGAQTAEVERLLREGIELRQQGNPSAALGSFERAHAIAHTPRTLAQVALAEQALGRWVDAEGHLREALRTADDPWIARNRAALDGALGVIAQHVGQVVVRCDVDGAELVVGGRAVGVSPLAAPTHVEAGELDVVATAGAERATEHVRVTAGETVFVEFHLRREAPPPPPNVATPLTVTRPDPNARIDLTPRGGAQRAWGWVALVGGVVGLGVGVGGALYRDDGVRAYNGNVIPGSSRNSRCPGTNHPTQPEDCPIYLDQVDAGTAMQWAGFVSGGVLTLTGILLLATAPSRVRLPVARLGCGRGPGEVGVACAGTF
jgi:hypothetical protein